MIKIKNTKMNLLFDKHKQQSCNSKNGVIKGKKQVQLILRLVLNTQMKLQMQSYGRKET